MVAAHGENPFAATPIFHFSALAAVREACY
jgi:hypothetical protein